MKLNNILCLLLCLALHCKAQKTKEVFISGKLVNFNNRLTVIDVSETGELRPLTNDREIAPDSAGNFSVHFKLQGPNYFQIGRNVLYLSPGDRMKVVIDYNWPEKSTFSGSAKNENYYLGSIPFPKAGSYLNGGINLKETLQENINIVFTKAQERRDKLNTLQSVTPEFINLENCRIDADIINSFKMLPGYFVQQKKDSKDNYSKDYKKVDSLTRAYQYKYSASIQKADFLKIEALRHIFYYIMDTLKSNDLNTAKIKDWQYAYELVYYINAAKNKKDLATLKVKIDSIKNPEYREAVRESFEFKADFREGDTAKDFQAYNIKNQVISLSSFKGKVIYIDLWATWCVPCLQELPFLDSLKMKYINNPNIIFISLCIDERTADWEKELQKRNLGGIQLLANSRQMLPYKIYAIPRAIIIDKNFKVLMMNGPMPSNPRLKDYLDGLLRAF